jgi:hypothetical protein
MATKYRSLNPGETLQPGDEFKCDHPNLWLTVSASFVATLSKLNPVDLVYAGALLDFQIRRPVKA